MEKGYLAFYHRFGGVMKWFFRRNYFLAKVLQFVNWGI